MAEQEMLPVANTDRELWREREGDYYANSIHVTESGAIGINVNGTVIVKPLPEWHRLAATNAADERVRVLEVLLRDVRYGIGCQPGYLSTLAIKRIDAALAEVGGRHA